MKKLPPNEGLKIFDIQFNKITAGPSPDNNKRTELFLFGCKKATCGNPCKGCFNSKLWDSNKAKFSWNPIEVADKINELSSSKYVTIGGGEPTDQIKHLIKLCKRLKEHDFHIILYTYKDLEKSINTETEIKKLLKYVDIVIDGEFDVNDYLYDSSACDGFYNSIGSGNQKIWDIKSMKFKKMKELKGLKLDKDNNLIYIEK